MEKTRDSVKAAIAPLILGGEGGVMPGGRAHFSVPSWQSKR